ncbi:MAG: ATP-binding cassette domain-containing protein [Clostridiales bacterium]|nr:ATP-binding cassette domain-containing protein [Clostridiales bacterium]
MLQIKHVCKQYKTGTLVQKALDDVTVNLRDNEFVAILGPSGSGKTTFLNIIGGLDRYDSGDLIINGTSTHDYKDRDWDAYRNHTIGFIFQSYNLIHHQTLVMNVELALTIAGVSRAERRKRALDALEKVGLGDQAFKRPSQLSGGQMQRVAIARALINNPDILLADEPTGALDSTTSLQVMELLKEVAKNRLVVFVTHNPDLAEKYATRIIKLEDGQIRDDSNPYDPEAEAETTAGAAVIPGIAPAAEASGPAPKKHARTSMSFGTAFMLSLRNLGTKKTRTLLTSIAGSIGIIGIALILAISSGVNRYVEELEADMITQYPIEINSTYYDVTTYISARNDDPTLPADRTASDDNIVDITALIYNIFSGQASNDLLSLRNFIESDNCEIPELSNCIEYSFGVTPQIYQDNPNEVIQIHPDHFFDVLGFGSTTSANSLMSSLVSTDIFFEMPEDEDLYKNDYTVLAGRWPESYNECILVTHTDGSTTDLGLYVSGLRDMTELDDMIDEFVSGEEVKQPVIDEDYTYDDFLGLTFKVVNSTDYYSYDEQYGIWTDRTSDDAYMQDLVNNGMDLTVVGIVKLNNDVASGTLSSGFDYLPSLTEYLSDEAAESDIVKQQLADPDINVFTGEPFGTEDATNDFDISSIFDIDEDAFADAFDFDEDALGEQLGDEASGLAGSMDTGSSTVDLSSLVDLSDIDLNLPDADLDLSELMTSVDITASADELKALAGSLLSGYISYSSGNSRTDITGLGDAIAAYLKTDGAKEILMENIISIVEDNGGITVSTDNMSSLASDLASSFLSYVKTNGYTDISQYETYLNEYLSTSEAQNIMNTWAEENLSFDLSDLDISADQLSEMAADLAEGYRSYAGSDSSVPDPAAIASAFAEYLATDDASEIMTQSLSSMIDTSDLESQIESALTSYMKTAASSVAASLGSRIESQVASAASQIMSRLSSQIRSQISDNMEDIISSLGDSLSIDPDALMDALNVNMDVSDLATILSSLTSSEAATYEDNLLTLGYTDFETPDSILIYPKDFESKDQITNILDGYNDRMEAEGTPEKAVSYTDQVGSIMSMVTEIVNILSYVLIAFVAISLIVSSIMIGVITYISVLERKQEIGILRAIGASKRNISQVFNAETIIIGLAAGLLGVLVTVILIQPINMFIHNFSGIYELSAWLKPWHALVLIALSVVLTLFSGSFPSRKASRSDPVEALRTE